jgi:hypothetical protein
MLTPTVLLSILLRDSWGFNDEQNTGQSFSFFLSLSLSLFLLVSLQAAWGTPPTPTISIGNLPSPGDVAPPCRNECQDNGDCRGGYVCVPEMEATCSSTGSPCDKLGQICDEGCDGSPCRKCERTIGFGRCSTDPKVELRSPPPICQRDNDCKPWWNGKKFIQKCDLTSQTVGRCTSQEKKKLDGVGSFCDPTASTDTCVELKGKCVRRSVCMPYEEAVAELAQDNQKDPLITKGGLSAAPPWRSSCLSNADCRADWVCVPPENLTCSTTGLPCKPSDRVDTICDVGSNTRTCIPVAGYGRCVRGYGPSVLDGPPCRQNDECEPFWHDVRFVQICDMSEADTVGRCISKLNEPMTGSDSFCNPKDKNPSVWCNKGGTCEGYSTCMPREEAQAELNRRNLLFEVG